MAEKSYLESVLSDIKAHIVINCDPEKYTWLRKGMLITDPDVLAIAKKELDYNTLAAAGKVLEITIDGSWDNCFRETEDNDFGNVRDFWNRLVTYAYLANHGLLVINISNIKAFKNCWNLKQLVKQEHDLILWPTLESSFDDYSEQQLKDFRDEMITTYGKLSAEQLYELIDGFKFDGYVMFVTTGFDWDEIKEYANKNDKDQFEDMMLYCKHLTL